MKGCLISCPPHPVKYSVFSSTCIIMILLFNWKIFEAEFGTLAVLVLVILQGASSIISGIYGDYKFPYIY
jgi:multidrug transporter EmrE-like cation transporter